MTRIYTKFESLFSHEYIRAKSKILNSKCPFKTHFSLVKPIDQIWSENNMTMRILTMNNNNGESRFKSILKIQIKWPMVKIYPVFIKMLNNFLSSSLRPWVTSGKIVPKICLTNYESKNYQNLNHLSHYMGIH